MTGATNAMAQGDDNVTGAVTDVRTAHRFDEDSLARYLAGRLPGAERGLRVRQFEGGQSNPTYLLEVGAAGGAEVARYVLRKKPSGVLLASAHMIEREQRVMIALQGSAVPVPEIPVFCEDASIIGTPFFVMKYVHGRILRDPSLPGSTPAERTGIVEAEIRTLAALHDVDWAARGLDGYGKPAQYVARQVARWSRQYRDSNHDPLPAMDWLMEWLPRHVPKENGVTITHGDFRLDNMVVHPTESRVLALLDWELATLGDPLTDLAYFCIPYHVDRAQKGVRGLSGHDLASLGIPSPQDVVRRYCALRGIEKPSPEVFSYYLAFSFFRLASIVAGIGARLKQGNASSDSAGEIAGQTPVLATIARRLAETHQ